MRLLNKKEFLKLTPPVLYSRWTEDNEFPNGLEMLTQTLPNDWIYIDLMDAIHSTDCEHYLNLIDQAKNDSSFELPLDYQIMQRDGSFNDSDRYFIYNPNDVMKLAFSLLAIANPVIE